MKILTGRLRGQKISFRPDPRLRPTTDKARKAIIDMLQGALEKRRVLDLFSGTGALGFEALSQGAAHVTFVEEDLSQCQQIRQGLKRWDLGDSAEVCHGEVLEWIRERGNKKKPFDLVFFDPPYGTILALRTLEAISAAPLICKDGFVVLECRRGEDIPLNIGRLKVVREKRYGQTKVLVYAAKAGSS